MKEFFYYIYIYKNIQNFKIRTIIHDLILHFILILSIVLCILLMLTLFSSVKILNYNCSPVFKIYILNF